jgi:molybdopterin-guanine dinucleotide biosynthesis protein A
MAIHGVVVAGGSSKRFGRNKLVEIVNGVPLRHHAIEAATATCDSVVVVGFDLDAASPLVTVVREDPPGSGPFAAVAAGVAQSGPAPEDAIVVLAGDLVSPNAAIPALIEALNGSGADAAVIIDAQHRRQPLLACYRASALLKLFASTDPVNRPAMQLLDGLEVIEVPDGANWSRDIDTPADLDS